MKAEEEEEEKKKLSPSLARFFSPQFLSTQGWI